MRLTDARTRISLKNVLFATDFSPVSEAALRYAEAVARRYGSKIFAVHVVSPSESTMVPPESWGACQQSLDDVARSEMQQLSGQLKGIPHETVLCYGGIWDAIQQLIESHQIDLLVVGTHGREGLGRLLMGSVAEELFRRAPCPVLTVGPHALPDVAPQVEFNEIVFATDFSPEANAAAPYAISLAQDYQARLTLLNVVKEPLESMARAELIVRDRQQALHAIIPPDAELWCSPEYVVEFGDPAQQVFKAAHERKAQLIVLGVRPAAGHLTAATHTSSATAHTIVSLAPCPVLSVRG